MRKMTFAATMMALVLGTSLCLAGCGARTDTDSETAAAQQETNAEATEAAEAADPEEAQDETVSQDWYKQVLEDQATKDQYPYYALADINLDGQDELFLSTTEDYFIGAENKACLMVYDNGQPKTLMEIGEGGGEYWVVNQSDATLTYFSRMSGEGHLILYKLENGALTQIGTADSYSPHHYVEDNEEQLFMIDGKEVSESEYDSYFEQYGNQAGAVTYQKY